MYIIFNDSTDVSTILIQFIKIFYAFVLDDMFCLLEHANELIHVQINLTLFAEFTMILNQT